MQTLSTGDPSTLGSYKALTDAVFGKESPQADYINKKIAESPNGELEEVVAHETQVLFILMGMTKDANKPE